MENILEYERVTEAFEKGMGYDAYKLLKGEHTVEAVIAYDLYTYAKERKMAFIDIGRGLTLSPEKVPAIMNELKRVGVHEITYSNCSTAGCEIIASLIDNGATLIKSVKVSESNHWGGESEYTGLFFRI